MRKSPNCSFVRMSPPSDSIDPFAMGHVAGPPEAFSHALRLVPLNNVIRSAFSDEGVAAAVDSRLSVYQASVLHSCAPVVEVNGRGLRTYTTRPGLRFAIFNVT